MLEKDTHDHVDDTSSETDNLTRLKQLLDEWKMYYLERDEKENGHVFELPLRTENEHHFRLRILLGKDQNICTIRIFFSFYVRKEDRYLMASRMAQINSDIHGTPILQDPGFFLFDPGDGELSFGNTFLIGSPMNVSVFTTMFVYLIQRAETVHDVLLTLCEDGFSQEDIDAFLEAALHYENEEKPGERMFS